MTKLEEALKSVDSKLLENKDFQKSLNEVVESLVLEKSEAKAQELFEEKEKEYAKSLDEQIAVVVKTIEEEQKEKFNEAVDSKVKEISEAYGVEVKAEAEKYLEEEVLKLQEDVKKYVSHAVQEFVDESEPKWQEEIEVLKAKKITERFTELSESFGVELLNISSEDKVKEVNESLGKSVDKISELSKEILKMKKEKALTEATSEMSAPQKDKFNSLIKEIEFKDSESFSKKIELYKTAIVDSHIDTKRKVDESKDKKPSWKK